MKITPDNFEACMIEILGSEWRDAFVPDEKGRSDFEYYLYCLDARQCAESGEWWEDDDLTFCQARQAWVSPEWRD